MRILVVEDEALIALVLVEILAEDGHEVLGPAATAEQALALCEDAPPQLALLDITLQGGGSGVEVARALHRRWGVPTIFASSQICEARRARDVALGCIQKPYAVETVLRSIDAARAVMGGDRPASPPRGFEMYAATG
ncbi:response regulator [Dankookia sp. P2]|uniref:response regulator n=1 Tax=Dankookia sp. P2 TaxID=3423955 RepID=UPI003D677F54